MIGAAFLAATAVGLLLLLVFGDRSDRWMVVAIVATLAIASVVEPLRYGTVRIGIAAVELSFFILLWVYAERTNRAWATAAAGFQLISVLSFTPVLLGASPFVWTGVALRYGAWGLITLTYIGGALECWAERRLRREAKDDGHLD